MNKYILVIALVAALGAIVSEAGSFDQTDSPVAPVAGEYDHLSEDEVLTEEEDRALSERNDDEEDSDDEEEEEEVDDAANKELTFVERLREMDIIKRLNKSDEEETAELRKKPEDFEKHEKFCYKVRDDVNNWVRSAINNQVSWAMQVMGALFFDTAVEFGNEGNKAVAKGAELVKLDAKKFIDGMQVVLDVLKQTVLEHRERTVKKFKKRLNVDSFAELVTDACQELTRKRRQIDVEFGDKDWIKLGCVTVRRVKITERLCSVFIALKPVLDGFTD